jgi:hypothetical protein
MMTKLVYLVYLKLIISYEPKKYLHQFNVILGAPCMDSNTPMYTHTFFREPVPLELVHGLLSNEIDWFEFISYI